MKAHKTSNRIRFTSELFLGTAKTRRRWPFPARFAVAALVLIMHSTPVDAASAVVPPQFEDAAGGGSQPVLSGDDLRYLSIYNPALFTSAMPEGAIINAIAFRLDEDYPSVSGTISDLEVRMSTSPSLYPDIPAPFASSIGPDERIVFRGPLAVTAPNSGSGLNPFDIRIPLSDSFIYDPRNGSLALDVRVHGVATLRGFLVDSTFAGVGSVRGSIEASTTTGLVFPAGIVQIEFQPIPEPAAYAVLGIGLLFFLRKEVLYEFYRIFRAKR